MTHKILFVDDEENILKALKRLFRKGPYETFFSTSGKEAIEIVKTYEIAVLVTDMRMPQMSGVELIMEANKISPDTIKTILSGYSDINDIMTAINNGHVHNYITKPWNESELMISLMNATELYERRIREKKLTEELHEKNKQLETMNKNLESIVKDRTRELQASNLILNAILEGEDQKKIMNRITAFITTLTGGKSVMILESNSGSVFGSQFIKKDSKIFTTGISRLKPCILNSVLVIPLTKSAELLGTIFIDDVTKNELQFVDRLKNLNAVLKMYLSQKAFIDNSTEVMGSIDAILENMDD